MSINIEDIKWEDKLRDERAKLIYEKILDECCDFIKTVYRNFRKKQVLFSIPYCYLNNDDYSFCDCICYIIDELRRAGFYVRYVKPNTLYISWINRERENKIINNQKRILLENVLTSKTIEKTCNKKNEQRLLE